MPPTTHNLHQQQYKTQTLAPLRLSQEHFNMQSPSNKTNTINGHYPHVPNSSSSNKLPQLHHSTHRGSLPQQYEANNNKNYSRSNSCSSNNSNSTMSHNSQVSTASPDSPPELPIRNGLISRNNNFNNIHNSSSSNKVMKHYH